MSDLKIRGRVTQVLEEKSGTGRNGPWRKQDFILETEGNYPRELCVTQWGDNIDAFGVQVGDTLTAHIDIQSREYEGRWYTDVKAWKVEKAGGQPDVVEPGPFEHPTPGAPSDVGPDDDLPF